MNIFKAPLMKLRITFNQFCVDCRNKINNSPTQTFSEYKQKKGTLSLADQFHQIYIITGKIDTEENKPSLERLENLLTRAIEEYDNTDPLIDASAAYFDATQSLKSQTIELQPRQWLRQTKHGYNN